MQRVLTEILETKVNDPRVEGVYITDVSVDRELDYANVYVSSLGGHEDAEEILTGLQNASGFLRFNLSQEIELRKMPELRFAWDNTPERADRIEELLAEIREERESFDEDQDIEVSNEEELDGPND